MSPLAVPAPFSSRALSVLVLSLLVPVALAIVVFPTPLYDTRELIAWGRQFPLVTPDHPPMMVWVGGTVDRLFGASAAVMILAGQLLLAVGLWYLHATLRLITTPDNAALFTFLFGTSFYTVFAPLSFALNADLLQMTSWPAVVFHGLRASRSRRLGHWLAFGGWTAVAVLTKYNAAVLLASMTIAMLAVPAFRPTLRAYGLYVAVGVAAVLIAPHVMAVLRHREAVSYGLTHFDTGSSLAWKLGRLGELGLGHLVSFLPGVLIVLFGIWKGVLAIRSPRTDATSDEHRFLLVMNAAMLLMLVGLVLIGGLNYIFRFSPPYAMMLVLALAPCVTWRDGCKPWVERRVVPDTGWIVLAVGAFLAVLYTAFASHSAMQEPTTPAARMILADWDSRYTCGPAYFLGGRQGVYGIGIEAGRGVMALGYMDIAGAPWFDRDKLHAFGAVVIDTDPEIEERMGKYLPGIVATEERTFTLPLRRTYKAKTLTYHYHFVPPHGCGG